MSARTVASLLKNAGYSHQSNSKTKEGSSHPDRNAQFEYIAQRVSEYQRSKRASDRPTAVISTHTESITASVPVGPVTGRSEDPKMVDFGYPPITHWNHSYEPGVQKLSMARFGFAVLRIGAQPDSYDGTSPAFESATPSFGRQSTVFPPI